LYRYALEPTMDFEEEEQEKMSRWEGLYKLNPAVDPQFEP
jgi:hypothetical protein